MVVFSSLEPSWERHYIDHCIIYILYIMYICISVVECLFWKGTYNDYSFNEVCLMTVLWFAFLKELMTSEMIKTTGNFGKYWLNVTTVSNGFSQGSLLAVLPKLQYSQEFVCQACSCLGDALFCGNKTKIAHFQNHGIRPQLHWSENKNPNPCKFLQVGCVMLLSR